MASTSERPGESRSDLWQIVEFAKYFKTDEVWGEELLAQMPEYRGKTLYEVLYENGEVNKYKVPTDVPGYINDEADHFGYYLQKGLFEEYADFGRGHGHDLAPFDTYHQVRGLRWPVVDGKEPYGVTVKALTRMSNQVKISHSMAIQIKKRLF